MKTYLFTLLLLSILLSSCSGDSINEAIIDIPEEESLVIKSSPISAPIQRTGDPVKGKEYLFSGDYMSSGIPYNAYVFVNGENTDNLLNRTGDNAIINHDYTAFNTPNGAKVVAPNCLSCHSSLLNNDFIVGLGDHNSNFTSNRANEVSLLNTAIINVYGQDSKEWDAYDQFRKSITAIGPKTIMASKGVNPANKIAEVLISHRNKETLEWVDEPNVVFPDEVLPADVPAWWLLKKKNAMFSTAIGRLDFCKSFIGASLLTLSDATKATEVDEKMVDVLAYIKSLEAPKYPFAIDAEKANTGKALFENNCSTCHGTYGDNETYPNLLVALESVETDPELSNHYAASTEQNNYFMDWFNTGWFGSTQNPLQIKSEEGYIAPPLDGIWASAPYFHNASVPTLAHVLNSKNRPEFWSRTFISTDYDTSEVGWNYNVETSQENVNTYNTTLKGYGNGGHRFGDAFSSEEREAVLEYLKTL